MSTTEVPDNGSTYIPTSEPPTIRPHSSVQVTSMGDPKAHSAGRKLVYSFVCLDFDADARCACGFQVRGLVNAVFNTITVHSSTGSTVF